MTEIRIDLSRMVGELARVLFEPHTSFIERLHSEGRITDAEIEGLYREFEERIPRLSELIQPLLLEAQEAQAPSSNPDTSG